MTVSQTTSDNLSVASLTKAQRRKLQALSAHHEIGATIGVLNMMMTVAIAVRFPDKYWMWHAARSLIYLPTRYVRFRKRKWEFYLLDWCYIVTYLSNICALLALLRVTTGIETPLVDFNADLIRAGFAMACGPLATSVYIFRNSIVFHDVDHSTSVFIHLSPFVLFWCLRWGAGNPSTIASSDMFMVCDSEEEYAAADACLRSVSGILWCNACAAPLSAFVVPPLLLYLVVWSIPYFLIMFVWCRDWLEKTGRETLYSYFMEAQPEFHARLERKFGKMVGRRLAGPFGYMMLHLTMTVVLGATSFILWHSFLLHNIMLLLVISSAVHNGSTYMFRVFAYRYADEQLQKHKAALE